VFYSRQQNIVKIILQLKNFGLVHHNACVEKCPVNISPLSIIMDMRRYLVMEQSAAPMPLNAMMTNIVNNCPMAI
jgi:Fe-S oxidoreductase